MHWNRIEANDFKAWTAKPETPHKDMCPIEHPAMYQVVKCSKGWSVSYGYISFVPGNHKTEYHRTDIVAVCDTPELAMAAAENHERGLMEPKP